MRAPNKKSSFRLMEFIQILEQGKWISVEKLSERLKVDTRTIYRYVDKIKDMEGLKNQGNSYCIQRSKIRTNTAFNEQEIEKLRSLLYGTIDKELSDKLLAILMQSHEKRLQTEKKIKNSIYNEHIKAIEKAIIQQKKILIHEYHGVAQSVTNVIISPVLLDYEGERLYAWKENEGKLLKRCYNLDRMGKIAALKQAAVSDGGWDPNKDKDPFGFIPISGIHVPQIPVHFTMTAVAWSLLTRQFPRLGDYTKKIKALKIEGKDLQYELNINVYDIKPIARFVSGLLSEIRLDEKSPSYEKIRDYIKQNIFEGYLMNYQSALLEEPRIPVKKKKQAK